MEINTAREVENGILINEITFLSNDNQSGHIRSAYNEWIEEGNSPDGLIDLTIEYRVNRAKLTLDSFISSNIEYSGNIFQCDASAREAMREVLEHIDRNSLDSSVETRQWRLSNNTFTTVTGDDISEILNDYRMRKDVSWISFATWLAGDKLTDFEM